MTINQLLELYDLPLSKVKKPYLPTWETLHLYNKEYLAELLLPLIKVGLITKDGFKSKAFSIKTKETSLDMLYNYILRNEKELCELLDTNIYCVLRLLGLADYKELPPPPKVKKIVQWEKKEIDLLKQMIEDGYKWNDIKKKLPLRGMLAIKKCAQRLGIKQKRGAKSKWTKEDLDILLRYNKKEFGTLKKYAKKFLPHKPYQTIQRLYAKMKVSTKK